MVKRGYIPERGDIVWVDFSPQRGREQANWRPALVLSPKFYNEKVGLSLICPVTSVVKGYPFEVMIDEGKVHGVVLADQVRSLDWRERHPRFITKVTPRVLKDTILGVIALVVSERGPVA